MNMQTAKETEKSFIIKVPVYCSEIVSKRNNDMFGGVTYEDMVKYVHEKVEKYNEQDDRASRNKRNKVQKREIGSVKCIDHKLGNRPCILLQISAYNTNLHDGYVETDKRITLKENHKVGSENYYVLLVPDILGLDPDDFEFRWIFLIYEDPLKDTQEIISTAKLVLGKILGIKSANIKLPQILEELKILKKMPQLSLSFKSITNDENDLDARYREYLVESKLKENKEQRYQDMPFDVTEELINDTSYTDRFQKRVIKVSNGQKEFRITHEQLTDASTTLKEAVEEIFNAEIAITEEDLNNRIYHVDFIMEKLAPVVHNYLGQS